MNERKTNGGKEKQSDEKFVTLRCAVLHPRVRFVGKVLGELRTKGLGTDLFAKGSNDSFVSHGKSLSTNKSLQSVALYKYIYTRTCKVIAKSDDIIDDVLERKKKSKKQQFQLKINETNRQMHRHI